MISSYTYLQKTAKHKSVQKQKYHLSLTKKILRMAKILTVVIRSTKTSYLSTKLSPTHSLFIAACQATRHTAADVRCIGHHFPILYACIHSLVPRPWITVFWPGNEINTCEYDMHKLPSLCLQARRWCTTTYAIRWGLDTRLLVALLALLTAISS